MRGGWGLTYFGAKTEENQSLAPELLFEFKLHWFSVLQMQVQEMRFFFSLSLQ
jgi:hypothetical protein